MSLLETVCVLLFLSLKLCAAVTISDEDYKLLPPMYDMDDYLTCNKETNVYCKIKMVLMPKDRNNTLWRTIMDAKEGKNYMEHDVIYRARCVSREYFPDTEKVMTYITELENRKLENISFHAKVERLNCKDNRQTWSVKDYFAWWLLLGYFIVILFVTVVDVLSRVKTLRMDLSNHKIISILSILRNWEALKKPITNADYDRLICFQGFRILNICIVIGGHSLVVATSMFTTNTRLLEEFLLNIFGKLLVHISLYAIQANFLMSGWLHTIQVYNAVEQSDNKKLPLKVIAEKLITRYLRFILPFTFYIGLIYLMTMYVTGPQTDILEADNEACRTYWWGNYLLINNFFYVKYMCNFASWYMSCDFQAHVVSSMALFYLMYKYNLGIKLFGAIFVLVGIINFYILYNAYKMNFIETVVVPARPAFLQLDNILNNDYGYFLHTPFFHNFSSYLVGILFGAVYYQYKNTKIQVTKIITIMWAIGFYGLPALSIILSYRNYSPIVSAIVGSLIKPLFSFGVGIGLLGMSHNVGGFVKRICTARALEFMSRWIFSIYVFHILLIFYSASTWMHMPELSYMFTLKVFFVNTILAVALGLAFHLIIEKPVLNFVNMTIQKLMYKKKTE